MLVSQLYEFFNKDVPKPERAVLKDCVKGDGIWDVLGYYDHKSKVKITICEPEVEKFSNRLAVQLNGDKNQIRLIVRELVRLHEHGHAMLHTGSTFSIKRRFKMGYRNLPLEINEPLTEFIAWSVIKDCSVASFESFFYEIDKNSPSYYKQWNQIKQLIDGKRKNIINYLYLVPGLIHIARNGVWNNFKHFLKGVSDHYKLIEALAIVNY
jgi:hypothetical protein